MSENTTVGPAGATAGALPITSHQTLGHTDDTEGGSDEASNDSLSESGSLEPIQYPH